MSEGRKSRGAVRQARPPFDFCAEIRAPPRPAGWASLREFVAPEPTHILLVDGDAGVRALLATMLEDEGYEVTTADSALRIVRQVSEVSPDLVLLDYELPGFRGTQAIRLLKPMMNDGRLREVPLALMSTDAPSAVLSEARKDGAIAYIDKSMGPEGIVKAVKAITRQQLGPS